MTTAASTEVGAGRRHVPTARRCECGAVTAETVMVLPVLVVAALGLVWVLSLATTQVRLTDAAREVARALAREEPAGTALALGRRVAPDGARISMDRGEREVVVTVSADVAGPGGLFRFVPSLGLHAEAVAATEPR